jgi:thiamine biosynthesis protein ThiI
MIKDEQIKMVTLISGGIDSPVATYLMANRGVNIIAVYFNTVSNSQNNNDFIKIKELIKQLERVTKSRIKLYIAPFEKTQQLIVNNCNRHVICILCKRMMLRIAEEIGMREKAIGLIMGDSLGQVASQTLQNLNVETHSTILPIIRPLIGFDKLEIENIAKEIGTYELSISPGASCSVVPTKPTTNASLMRIENEEDKLDINTIIGVTLEKSLVIKERD